ncbi:vitamin K epoxide reductase family protein [Rathayibacter sp. YIM 133350]|uniref:vitamin K epoxide reductase family protein n=1 Tax=Rathayibacter sp. YIM 133350 TaxID=3131992 RepID=UPI00307E551F
MSDTARTKPPILLGSLLAILGAIGLWAAFDLTLEKFHVLEHPGSKASCDFSVVVQCGANLASWQGSLFGFPNPVIGVICWSVVITIGVALLARAAFATWFWIGFNVGVLGALVFVIWLMGQSIFVLGTLCPWCMVTWAVVIPLFWIVTLNNLRTGVFPVGQRVRSFADAAYTWIPLITLVCYLVVAIIAQARLDVLRYIF